jgi:hypothetical protein
MTPYPQLLTLDHRQNTENPGKITISAKNHPCHAKMREKTAFLRLTP